MSRDTHDEKARARRSGRKSSANVLQTLIALAAVALVVLAWVHEGSRFAILLIGFLIVIGVVPIVLLRNSRSRQRKKNGS